MIVLIVPCHIAIPPSRTPELTSAHRTPIRYAILHGLGSCVELVKEMLKIGADIEAPLISDPENLQINHRRGMTTL